MEKICFSWNGEDVSLVTHFAEQFSPHDSIFASGLQRLVPGLRQPACRLGPAGHPVIAEAVLLPGLSVFALNTTL